ncbi:MAG TPA: beta-ketoacyl synthase N-terminal-like domain-containing protein, partial [Methylomirabilota bacterium]|nr:beta-ketoacyl synthase N-terminal-like domain-containing protein [Methylomirabilota bacterium]
MLAGTVTGEWLSPAEGRRMSPPSRLAVVASRMALADAGWPARRAADEGTAVVLGTAFGPSSFSEALIRQILDPGPEAASPFLFTESVANAPAAQVAIAAGCRGPNLTVCQREASALLAAVRGAGLVAGGKAPAALAGSVDEVSPLLHALLDRFGALSRGDRGDEVARPFDRGRDGLLAAEGATVLAIERQDRAAARGMRVLARILGGGGAFDPTAPVTGYGEGAESLAQSLGGLLERLGVPLERVDLVVSGASGSRGGDRLEAQVLKALWKDLPLPPVLAPKGVTGEYGGGFLAAAVLAAAGAASGPTAGFAVPDPALGLVPHDGRPLPRP